MIRQCTTVDVQNANLFYATLEFKMNLYSQSFVHIMEILI